MFPLLQIKNRFAYFYYCSLMYIVQYKEVLCKFSTKLLILKVPVIL